MKYLFALILVFAATSLNTNDAEAIPNQQEMGRVLQLQTKQLNQQQQNSTR